MSDKLPDNKDGLLELLKKLWAPIAGFLGAVTLAYNFYQLPATGGAIRSKSSRCSNSLSVRGIVNVYPWFI